MVADERWTPILDGERYCAPRCGAGCKKADYDAAVEQAEALARRMGPQWAPRVWENFGWHWEIRAGNSHVSQRRDGDFSAWVQVMDCGSNNGTIQFIEYAETPEDALGFAVQAARGCISRIEGELAAVREEEPAHA